MNRRQRNDAVMTSLGFGAERLRDGRVTPACRDLRYRVHRALSGDDRFWMGLNRQLDRNYLRNRMAAEGGRRGA